MNNMEPPAFVSSASCFGLGQSICERNKHGEQQTQEVKSGAGGAALYAAFDAYDAECLG